jgi:hypothetical protein
MNTESTRFDLQIAGADASSSASVSSTNPEDLMRLLVLSGQNKEEKTYTININSTQQSDSPDLTQSQSNTMNVRTKNPAEIARILQLCGLDSSSSESSDDMCTDCNQYDCQCDADTCSKCSHGDCDCGTTDMPQYGSITVAEQQAEYDYGHKDVDEDQDEFDIKDYNFKGRADLPERIISGRSGSNPLINAMKENIHTKILAAYKDFLGEGEVDNAAGITSPLTANARDEFDKDPLANKETDDSGEDSPFTNIELQDIPR